MGAVPGPGSWDHLLSALRGPGASWGPTGCWAQSALAHPCPRPALSPRRSSLCFRDHPPPTFGCVFARNIDGSGTWVAPSSKSGSYPALQGGTGLCYIKSLGRCRVLGPPSPRRGKGSGCRLHGLPGRPTGPGIKFRPSRGARAPVTPATRSPLLPGFRLGPSSFLLFGLRRPPQSLSSLSLGAQVTSPFNHEAL